MAGIDLVGHFQKLAAFFANVFDERNYCAYELINTERHKKESEPTR